MLAFVLCRSSVYLNLGPTLKDKLTKDSQQGLVSRYLYALLKMLWASSAIIGPIDFGCLFSSTGGQLSIILILVPLCRGCVDSFLSLCHIPN